MMIIKTQKQQKSERMLDLKLKDARAKKVKEVYGQSDPIIRKQLYDLYKTNPEYQKDLKKVKKWFKEFI